ncbi:MAG TPA: hypothetical protein PLQ01_10070, partial [Methanothrix sp.]|nr:hypothetical protein [Methanothrix sp.]
MGISFTLWAYPGADEYLLAFKIITALFLVMIAAWNTASPVGASAIRAYSSSISYLTSVTCRP